MSNAKGKSELELVRLFDAPAAVVWKAWTDPNQVQQWWGPRGFTLTTHARDTRTGGHWHYTMHGPDGTDYPNRTYYHEVVPLQKLDYDHGANENQPPLFRVKVEFREKGKQTEMRLRMIFSSVEAAEQTIQIIKKAGGNGTWDRLAEHVIKETLGQETFVLARSFQAPIATVFQMWTDPKHLSQWLPPQGFEMQFLKADIRAGGSSFYKMQAAGNEALVMFGKAQYLEIEKHSRLVYTQQFCSDKEQVTRHPMSPIWPESMRTTVTFSEEGQNQTRVTIQWSQDGIWTPAETETFVKGKASMTQGWTGSLDHLETYLR